jgi:fibronectin type 3 domain-containing protein
MNGHVIVHYNVYRSTTSGKSFVKLASNLAYPWYEDGGVSSGRTYFYVVTTLDPVGHESRFSDEVEATIP